MSRIKKHKRVIIFATLMIGLILAAVIGGISTTTSEAKDESKDNPKPVAACGEDLKESEHEGGDQSSIDAVAQNGEPTPTTKNSTNTVNQKSNTASNKQSTPKTPKPSEPKPTKVDVHTHSWTAVYGTRSIPHTKQVAWTKCYCCGADMTGNPGHIDIHLTNHESNVHYGTEYRTETYYTQEQYVTGYKCSCGATK